MDTATHKEEFLRIVNKYNLHDEDKAGEITDYIMQKKDIEAKEFARLFAMDEKDAVIFLSWIHKGIRFKEEHIDK